MHLSINTLAVNSMLLLRSESNGNLSCCTLIYKLHIYTNPFKFEFQLPNFCHEVIHVVLAIDSYLTNVLRTACLKSMIDRGPDLYYYNFIQTNIVDKDRHD